MRKNHNLKHKYDYEHTSEDEEQSRLTSKSESNSHNYKRKHKKHKHKGEVVDDINCKNGYDESPLRNEAGEVIEIHGSSSEDSQDENGHDREDGRKIGSHRYKHHRKEERRHKKRRKRSRSGSQSMSRDKEVEYTKSIHKKSRGEEERNNRNPSDSDSEYQSSNDHRKRKSREFSTNDAKEGDNTRRTAGESRFRNNYDGIKVKSEYQETEVDRVKKESNERQTKRHQSGSDMNRRNNNNHQEPSGSRSNARRRGNRDRDVHDWGGSASNKSKPNKPPGEVQKPNFGLSGKLTEDTNMYNGVVIKYSEPPEARMPKKRWRLYPFKGDQPLPPLYIHRQSAYLLGRDRKVVDMPIDHPSCSKQHAALQYRLISYERPNGTIGKQIRLYIIDLESANGTFINNKKIEARKYVELFEKDVIKFGFSSREYVLLHEHSKDDDNPSQDDT